MKKKLLLGYGIAVLLFFCCSSTLFAQLKTVTGIVTDEDKNPIPNVSVVVRGSTTGTSTDENGNYSILAKSTDVLIFTAIGYKSMGVGVGTGYLLNTTMTRDITGLSDVVVIGYGTARKKDLAGAVAVVNVNEMKKQPSSSITDQLQGRAAGVSIVGSSQPGEAPQIRIRGINSFGNNVPLYVVDGVPTQNIEFLNPNDIESIQVLKDAGSSSIYGSRASNGVLIVTTKRGKGKVNVSYDAYYGTQIPPKGNVWNTLTPQEWGNLKWMVKKTTAEQLGIPVEYNDPLYGSGATPVVPDYILPVGAKEGSPEVDPSKYYVNPNYTTGADYDNFYRITKANKAGTDWFHEVVKAAPINSHNLDVSSGSDKGSFLFGLNYFNQQGMVLGTYSKKYSLRLNSQYNVSSRIRIGENFSYSITDNPRMDLNQEYSPVSRTFEMHSIIPVYDIMGNYAGTYGGQLGQATNPVANQQRSLKSGKGSGNNLLGNIFAEVDVLKDLLLRTSFGGEYWYYSGKWFGYPTYENAENGSTNTYGEYWGGGFHWTWSNTATYHKIFGDHDVKILVGTESYDTKSNWGGASKKGYFSFDPNFTTLNTGSNTPYVEGSRGSESLVSYFGRLDYSILNRYILSTTIRRDGSSKFLNNRWGTFPAVSAAWRLSEEPFMASTNPWLTDLKIRGSWGIMGSQFNVGSDNAFTLFRGENNISYYDLNGTSNSLVEGFFRRTLGNPDAKWESDMNANIGFDMTIKNGLLDVSADYYRKDINDLLFSPALPGTAGMAWAPAVNIGKMKNEGVDISIGSRTNLSKDLVMNVGLNFMTYNNKILKIADGQTEFTDGGTRIGDVVLNRVGNSISSFYGYKIIGFWNSQAEIDQANETAKEKSNGAVTVYQPNIGVGRFKYDDQGKGYVTPESRVILGSPNPDFSYGLNLGFTYKNLDLSSFFYGVQGAEAMNMTKWWTDFYASFGGAKSKTALYDSWRPDNHNAKVAIQENDGTVSTNSVVNSYYLENASYFRLKNLQLGYSLPASLTEKLHVNRLRVYLQGTNLFTITRYSGLDPEIAGKISWDKQRATFGVDEGSYPVAKQIIFGVNLNF